MKSLLQRGMESQSNWEHEGGTMRSWSLWGLDLAGVFTSVHTNVYLTPSDIHQREFHFVLSLDP